MPKTTQADAEQLAIAALGHLAGDPELLSRFLAVTGIVAGQIRQAATEPAFLTGVLNFYLAHEPSLLRLSDALGVAPASIVEAARMLPAGDDNFERST